MKTLRERFSLVRPNNYNTTHANNTPLTDLEESGGSGAHGHELEKDDDHHDHHDDDLLSLTAAAAATVAQHHNTGSPPHLYQILLRLRRLVLLQHRRLLLLVKARPLVSKALIILLCTATAVSDPPFHVYPYIISIMLTVMVQSICWPCHTYRLKSTVTTLVPIYLIVWLLFHQLAATTEVKRIRSHSFDISQANFNKSRHFYYMQTVATDYDAKLTAKIHAISDFVNRVKVNGSDNSKQSTTNPPASDSDSDSMNKIEPLPVTAVKLFDNAIRFDFLLEFIRNDDFTADFACLIESDVVVHTQYFTDQWYAMSRRGVEFAYVQHVWGHVNFEAQNVGCLCVSKTASVQVVRWLRMMSYLNDRRYCRLLIKPLLYNSWMGLPAAKQHVFAWDRDGGCTVLRPYCNYIHFTRPKGPALDAAMKIVERGSFDVHYD
jgi:hypothetical protein